MPIFTLHKDPMAASLFMTMLTTTTKQVLGLPPIPGMVCAYRDLEASQLYPLVTGTMIAMLGVMETLPILDPWDGALVDDETMARTLFTAILPMAREQAKDEQ